MNFGVGILLEFNAAGAFPGDQAVEVVAIRSVAAEILLVEQAFDAAAQTNLIGVSLGANGPAHILVPAAAQDGDGGSCQTRGDYSERP